MTTENLTRRIELLSADERNLLFAKVKQFRNASSSEAFEEAPKRLIAYVQPIGELDEQNLKDHLKNRLPDYMVPSAICEIDQIPILPNGKVDRRSLKGLKKSNKEANALAIKEPTSELERQLVEIWQDVLHFKPISVEDNFFEIGGDSILSIQIISMARNMGLELSPNQLFEHQTISELAKSISTDTDHAAKWDFLVPLRKEGTKKPLFCIHSGGGHVFFYNQLTEYMEPNRPIYALQSSGLSGNDDMHQSIEDMTTDYTKAIRVIQPEGPYNVLVYCFSATVGNEMAFQLGKKNQDINIIVVDTMAAPWTLNKHGRLEARARSFFIRFFKNPVSSIKTFFEDRFWWISPLWFKLFGTENQKELEKVKINLRNICLAYEWKKHPGKVSLVLTEKPHESLQKVTIDSWRELAQGGIELFYTKGNHRTLFEEPDVRFVSEKIDEAIIE